MKYYQLECFYIGDGVNVRCIMNVIAPNLTAACNLVFDETGFIVDQAPFVGVNCLFEENDDRSSRIIYQHSHSYEEQQ